jgi:3-methylfumaryl-CoA hydratase
MQLLDWIGRSETAEDRAAAGPFAALAATLDISGAASGEHPAPGTPLPPLWHWLYLLPLPLQSRLGPDGHALRGGFLPPVALPRRMWAGSDLVFHAPLRVGDALARTSTIVDVQEKSGRSGNLVFVKVCHELRREGSAAVALTEHQHIVYRAAPGPKDVAPAPRAGPSGCAWERSIVPDPVLLFRYSALTFNGHRIHYDQPYATGVEGYPGLVVHGPLIATLLLDLLRRNAPGAAVAAFEFRALRPVFDTHAFSVHGQPAPDGRTVHLWATDHEGWLAMDAQATLAA